MAVTGRLDADFSAFTAAVQGAIKELGALEAAGERMNRSIILTDPLPLKETTKAVKEVTGATENASGAFGFLGRQVAAALTIGAAVRFASSVMDLAGEIGRLSEATGLTADEVQRLMAVSNATSVPIDALTKASMNLTLAVGSGDAGLKAALHGLGIEFREFAGLSQGQQFDTIAAALGGVEDQTEKARLAYLAFGGASKQVLGAMRPDVKELGDATVKMSDDAIAGLNRLDTAWKNLKTSVKAAAGELVNAAANQQKLASPAGDTGNADLMREWAALAHAAEQLGDQLPAVAAKPGKALADLAAALPPVTLGMNQAWGAAGTLADEEARLKAEAEKMAPIWAAQAAELKKHAEAMVELNSAGGDWRATLDGIGGDTVEGIKYYLEAGVAQGTLATAYGLTAVQVKAVAEALKEETDASRAGAAESARQMGLMNARADAYDALVQRQLTGDATTRASAQANADAAASAYAVALSHADQYTATRLEQLRTESEAAEETLRNWSATAESTMTQVKGAAEQAGAALGIVSARLGGANQGTVYAGGATFPSSESLWAASMAPGSMLGGPTLAESRMRAEMNARFNSAMASTQNAESDFWLRQIGLPSTGTGVTVQRGAVEINYPIMDDPAALDQIAKLVGDAVMARMTRTGTIV